jgi:hypothetical protein
MPSRFPAHPTRALPDTASGADSINATVTTTLTETGTAVDGFSVVITSTLTDVGAGTDSITVARAVPLSETGSAADALTVVITVSLTDTGHGTDGFANSGQPFRDIEPAPPLCNPRGLPVSSRPRGAQPFRSRREAGIQFGEVHHDPCDADVDLVAQPITITLTSQKDGTVLGPFTAAWVGTSVNIPDPNRPGRAGAHLLQEARYFRTAGSIPKDTYSVSYNLTDTAETGPDPIKENFTIY